MSSQLKGKKIIITREEARAHLFSEKISKYGGIPIEVPLLKIICKDHSDVSKIIKKLHDFQWVFFTSANGVDCFLRLMDKYNVDYSTLSERKIAVVGHKTGEALKKFGITSDFIPSVYDAETMADEFLEGNNQGPILLIRGNLSRDVLPKSFQHAQIKYTCLEVYDTVERLDSDSKEELKKAINQDYDFITFTSPSAVNACYKLVGPIKNHACVSIGTTTEHRLKELGFSKVLTPREFTIDGMIQKMIDYVKGVDE